MARMRTATRTGVSSRRKVVTWELANALSKPAAKMAIRTAVRRRSRAATTWMPIISVLGGGWLWFYRAGVGHTNHEVFEPTGQIHARIPIIEDITTMGKLAPKITVCT
jgi:hypothetical protein